MIISATGGSSSCSSGALPVPQLSQLTPSLWQQQRINDEFKMNTAALSCVCDGGRETNVEYCGDMLVPVEYKSVSKWVRVPKVEDVYNYSEFLQGVLAKFNLPGLTSLMLKDSTGVEVDSDIFDELLNSSRVSFKAFTEECNGPPDSSSARDIVNAALHSRPGGDQVIKEYEKKKGLCDGTRRKMINILVADMVESHGRIPPAHGRITYALGITTLFPNLKDPDSKNGYEHFYDHQSGSGYLA
ncbi:hypothetical protein NQZ68_029802 [Dissostichus eleginoides]|nr:hypothetical protein NQZ68_029802 [Dissostichus eleginoides]